ncbi:retrovirus-related Pol polyprotein from transposon TNT 1-94 [Trichonephila clavipes]|nr:retrovirus-related Pol polyprotein from transposon TNT 1-94 [Trichonephila clavipes]
MKTRWLPQEFQSTVQQIYKWKEEDFRVVKIEAELILEANRLQLMKQDLEKAENAYLSSFTLKKSKTLPATAAAHGNPNGKNDYQRKVVRQKVNSNLGYNLNLPDYYDDEDDSDRAKDSLTRRLVSKTSTETPSTSEKPDVSSDNHSLIPCTEVKWIRNIDLSEQQEALMVEVTIPICYKQAIRSRDASKWHDAMDKEINVMKERKVWDLVDYPDNIKILENRWVYTIKYDENNKIFRYKARLVARGNTQLRGTVSRTPRRSRRRRIDEGDISIPVAVNQRAANCVKEAVRSYTGIRSRCRSSCTDVTFRRPLPVFPVVQCSSVHCFQTRITVELFRCTQATVAR